MTIQKRLIIYISTMMFTCGAIIGGAIYLIFPIYNNLSLRPDVLSSVKGIILLLIISGALILICALICAFVMAALVVRSVIPPLKLLAGFAEKIREGNLDCRMDYAKGDEFEPVFRAFDAMREKLKNSLEETAEMEENRIEMIASLAHDIKTPVTSICAYSESLRDGIAQTPETQLRYMETIVQKARLVDNLVNDLFLFSKLDIRHDSLSIQKVNSADFLRAVFDETAKNEAYTLNYEILGLENEAVMINKTAFERIIQNITQNSVCHSLGGRVIIRILARVQDNNVLIKISDNGTGVDEEVCEHVFDRFYRADKSRSGSGSGLGLPICRRLITAMNGKIWARSGKTEGFTIYISLPIVIGDVN